MKKRLIAIMLALVLSFSMLPYSAFATDNDTVICVDSIEAAPGSTATVNVSVTNNPGILSATFNLTWDEGLTLTAAENGEAYRNCTADPEA